ncbi:serine/threonine-protein kinase [Streptomyces sp. NBC_01276]|uniref:serine/threonine-protein kinase n=1 Tax=Streptomyces sp. NBC_01276 TaxID=2903808 RepID=UPI00352E2712
MGETAEGLLIAGRYRLAERIGGGGMGAVWRAFDQSLRVEVAVKQVTVSPHASAEQRQQALAYARKEARHAVALRHHPNIVAVHDVAEHDGMPWMVMDLVEGQSLARMLESGLLTTQLAHTVAAGVLAALKAAHRAGIVHRDVKPANIMIDRTGHVLLTDFGIAKHSMDTRLTAAGALVGTAEYIAPERFRDDERPAGDLFSLGASLYEAVEGVSPFRRGSVLSTMNAVASEEPAPPKNAGHLAALILRLLDKDPDARPTIPQAEAALEGVPVGRQAIAVPKGVPWGHWVRVLAMAVLLAGALFLPLLSEVWTDRETGTPAAVETLTGRMLFPWHLGVPRGDLRFWDRADWIFMSVYLLGTAAVVVVAAARPLLVHSGGLGTRAVVLALRVAAVLWCAALALSPTYWAALGASPPAPDEPEHPEHLFHVTPMIGVWLLWLVGLVAGYSLLHRTPTPSPRRPPASRRSLLRRPAPRVRPEGG